MALIPTEYLVVTFKTRNIALHTSFRMSKLTEACSFIVTNSLEIEPECCLSLEQKLDGPSLGSRAAQRIRMTSSYQACIHDKIDCRYYLYRLAGFDLRRKILKNEHARVFGLSRPGV